MPRWNPHFHACVELRDPELLQSVARIEALAGRWRDPETGRLLRPATTRAPNAAASRPESRYAASRRLLALGR